MRLQTSVLCGVLSAMSVFAADPFVGTWKINVEKSSNTDPAADRAQISGRRLIYEAVSPNSYRITSQRPDRTAKMLARMDGKDYSNDSDGRDYEKDSTLPPGAGTFTIAWRRIDERHHLLIFKKSGKEYSRRDTSISPDGAVLSLRQWGLDRSSGKPFDYTLVFDKEVTGAAQQLPPVYFNHTDIILDPAVYDALAQSAFLKEQFGFVEERAVRRDNGQGAFSDTGLEIHGRQTYFAFSKTDQSAPRPRLRDQINFNMWIDDRERLPLIRDSLARKTHTQPTFRASKSFINGPPGFNSLDTVRAGFPVDRENVRAGSSVIARYADYFRRRYPDLKPEEDGTTREKEGHHFYLPDRLLNDITRFTLTVNKTEADQLLQEFKAYGYAVRRDGERQIATGPEIEFVLLNAQLGSPRKLAIDMKLNRSTAGDQSYRFGESSELRFNGDMATWYFPAGWRP